jgi:hypothetical protein
MITNGSYWSKGIAEKRKAGQNYLLFFAEGCHRGKGKSLKHDRWFAYGAAQARDKALLERRAEMEKQLARMDRTVAVLGGEKDGRRGRRTSVVRFGFGGMTA